LGGIAPISLPLIAWAIKGGLDPLASAWDNQGMNRLALVAVALLLLPMPSRAEEPAAVKAPTGKVVGTTDADTVKEPPAPKVPEGKAAGVTDAPEKKAAGDAPGNSAPGWWTVFLTVVGWVICGLLGYFGRWFHESLQRVHIHVEDWGFGAVKGQEGKKEKVRCPCAVNACVF
jgi:hypothetical protein